MVQHMVRHVVKVVGSTTIGVNLYLDKLSHRDLRLTLFIWIARHQVQRRRMIPQLYTTTPVQRKVHFSKHHPTGRVLHAYCVTS